MDKLDFYATFKTLTGHAPFPWQEELYRCFAGEDGRTIPQTVSIPTGLGKTNVIAVWLIALANGAAVPRRLVYVVNRRTVVDQTTDEVERLRKNLANKPELGELRSAMRKLSATAQDRGQAPLAISTLRGQFADNREWSADPSRPAVICGTVDMIGSRLLFSGYGIGFRSRPLHAGFLGQDALLVHDEAHLEPAFQKLIESIECEQKCRERTSDLPWPKLCVMQLTATTRNGTDKQNDGNQGRERPFELTDTEKEPPTKLPDPPTEPIHYVWRRLKAKKALTLHQVGDGKDAVAEKVADLALKQHKEPNADVLVFVQTLDQVKTVCEKLTNKRDGVSVDHVHQFTGTMRGLERDRMADPRRSDASPVFARFLKRPKPDAAEDEQWKTKPISGTVYLVCTSAGEVGIDISADHMVCDLSTFESMAQRFGRVNRYCEPIEHVARIDVVHPSSFGKIDKKTGELKADDIDKRRQKTLDLLKKLPALGDDRYDASPLALGNLDVAARQTAFAPEPAIPPATDILFDAWALTSIRKPMPGRPPVEPYLRGIAEWQRPETYVAWRREVEIITDELREQYPPTDLLDDYPLKPHELLRDRSDRVFKQLEALSKQHQGKPVWVLDGRGAIEPTTLEKLVAKFGQIKPSDRDKRLNDCTIVLPPSVGGLTVTGTLDGAAPLLDESKYDVADEWRDENRELRRQRIRSDESKPDGSGGMALIRTIDTDPDADERESSDEEAELESTDDATENASPKRGRYWHWYARPRDAEDATRASTRPITWNHHTHDVAHRTAEIVEVLNLPDDLKQAITLAAELHDLGKKRELWQRSIGNPNPIDWYAKPGKPDNGPRWRPQRFSNYRHEFGSLLDAQTDARLNALSNEMKDLVLHLIAAHHGRARPHFDLDEAFDPTPPAGISPEDVAVEIPRRFARLQRRYGRWGLAYLESLLRAADWAASAEPSRVLDANGNEVIP